MSWYAAVPVSLSACPMRIRIGLHVWILPKKLTVIASNQFEFGIQAHQAELVCVRKMHSIVFQGSQYWLGLGQCPTPNRFLLPSLIELVSGPLRLENKECG